MPISLIAQKNKCYLDNLGDVPVSLKLKRIFSTKNRVKLVQGSRQTKTKTV